MASRPMLPEEDLSCSVCFKIFEDPVLLCCSHSFCRACVNKWWKENLRLECPVCKTQSPSRNPPRNLALKNLCEAFSQQGLQTPSAGSQEVCSLHNEMLQLFCLDHEQPVCMACLHSEEHAGHSFKPITEVARHHKAEALKSLEPLKEKLKALQKNRGDCVQEADMLKVQAQEKERKMDQDFLKLLEDMQKAHLVNSFALREETESKSQEIKENIDDLSREIEVVSKSIRDVEEQLEAPDVVFLQKYKDTIEKTLGSMPQEPQRPPRTLNFLPQEPQRPPRTLTSLPQEPQRPPRVLKHVTTPTINIANHMETQNHPPVKNVQQTMKPATPERGHSSHAGMLMLKPELWKYACKLTLDPDTVNRNLILSEDNSKVSPDIRKQSYPDHPGRFNYYTQVLCCEGLTGRRYWEVDWIGKVYIGVTYRGISRKGMGDDRLLGRNNNSWILECSFEGYTARHNNMTTPICLSSSLCKFNRVGVYLDWPAGSLSFYTVSSDTLTHIHTFTCTFTEELLAGFWMGFGSVSLCQMK